MVQWLKYVCSTVRGIKCTSIYTAFRYSFVKNNEKISQTYHDVGSVKKLPFYLRRIIVISIYYLIHVLYFTVLIFFTVGYLGPLCLRTPILTAVNYALTISSAKLLKNVLFEWQRIAVTKCQQYSVIQTCKLLATFDLNF